MQTLYSHDPKDSNRVFEEFRYDDKMYRGYTKYGEPDGSGVMQSEDSKWKYTGSWKNGLRHGKGIYEWDGSMYKELQPGKHIYDGEWKKGLQHGEGIYIEPNLWVTQGIWENSELKEAERMYKSLGYGSTVDQLFLFFGFKSANKSFKQIKIEGGMGYRGEVKNKRANGRGIFEWKDGTTHDGEWKNSLQHGMGIYTSPSREIFEWKATYDGKWILKDILQHGTGIYTRPCSWVTEGIWEYGKLKSIKKNYKSLGYGRFVDEFFLFLGLKSSHEHFKEINYKNGDMYKGEVKYGKREGKGIYKLKNGTTFEGEWKNGRRHGKGIYTKPDLWVTEGIWENGKLKSTKRKYKSFGYRACILLLFYALLLLYVPNCLRKAFSIFNFCNFIILCGEILFAIQVPVLVRFSVDIYFFFMVISMLCTLLCRKPNAEQDSMQQNENASELVQKEIEQLMKDDNEIIDQNMKIEPAKDENVNGGDIPEVLLKNVNKASAIEKKDDKEKQKEIEALKESKKRQDEKLEKLQEEHECKICLDNHWDHVLGCGHVYCGSCAKRVKNCPLCRKRVTSIIKIFH